MTRYAFILLTAALAVFTSGCISSQRTEFRGIILQGPATASAPQTNKVHQVGLEFACQEPSLPDAVCGYGISGTPPDGHALIFFVYSREKYVANDCRISNEMHPAVYLASWRNPRGDFWKKFLAEDAATRDRTEGLRRLQGSCVVEKWKENGNFRIRLDMKSPGPDPVAVNGLLTTFDKWQFNPVLGFGLILSSMGIVGE